MEKETVTGKLKGQNTSRTSSENGYKDNPVNFNRLSKYLQEINRTYDWLYILKLIYIILMKNVKNQIQKEIKRQKTYIVNKIT